jgi:hypothetical protein
VKNTLTVKNVPVPKDEKLAAQHADLQIRIDESAKILKTGKTSDPARWPFFFRFANECVIACHQRLQRGLTDPSMA